MTTATTAIGYVRTLTTESVTAAAGLTTDSWAADTSLVTHISYYSIYCNIIVKKLSSLKRQLDKATPLHYLA